MTQSAAPAAASPSVTSAAPAPSKTLLANSTLAFVLAATVSNTLHEGAHALAGRAQGLVPTLTPFSVAYTPQPTHHQALVNLAAGPVFSLVLGLVLMLVSRNWGRGIVRLFFLWLSFMAVMNFMGYLFIAPFASVGDTGQILHLLHAPVLVYVLVGLAGVAGQLWLANRFAGQVKRYAPSIDEERQMIAFRSWILGTVIVMALTLIDVLVLHAEPAVAVVVVFYSCAIAIFAPMQFLFRRRFSAGHEILALRPGNVLALTLTIVLSVAEMALAIAGGTRLG